MKPDEDLAVHFRDAAVDVTGSDPATDDVGVTVSRKNFSPSPGPTPATPVRRNRAGIRRLDDNADLHAYFLTADGDVPEQKTPDAQASADTKHTGPAPLADIPTDRHGIPRLDNQADLNRIFDAAVGENGGDEDWGVAMRQSLEHDARGLMKKKTGGFYPPRRLTLKEKLQRYPSPQAQLDLHGATAARARQRAEAFIRSARADGLYTVRIIVGKGLHSEGGAVLPDVIEDRLVELKREDLVLSYRWEKRVKRKSGAVIVFLATDFP